MPRQYVLAALFVLVPEKRKLYLTQAERYPTVLKAPLSLVSTVRETLFTISGERNSQYN